ncbi:MAG TPA: helix-turn-helix domain-containing protein [Alphaproteobacteria bacterium]|jgi:DNA-binding HxlR family transcriptional regulator
MREAHHAECPMDSLLRLLMGPWTSYIIWVLRNEGPTRFGELKRKVPGISAKVLTERLRMLEGAELITRHHEPTIPPQVTYALAPRGEELRGILDTLNGVALRWRAEDQTKKNLTPDSQAPDCQSADMPAAGQKPVTV